MFHWPLKSMPPRPTLKRLIAVPCSGVGATLCLRTRSATHWIALVASGVSVAKAVRSLLAKRPPAWCRNGSNSQEFIGGGLARPKVAVAPLPPVMALAASVTLSQVQEASGYLTPALSNKIGRASCRDRV